MNSLLRSLLVVIIILALLVACVARVGFQQLTTPAGESSIATEIVVEPGDTLGDVTDRLASAGLISNSFVWDIFVRFNKPEHELQPGTYYISPNMSMRQILETLHQPVAQGAFGEETTVRTIEGMRLEEIAAVLEENEDFEFSGEEFLELARNGNYFKELTDEDGEARYPFLSDLPLGASLEGYLFPDTYNFFVTATYTDVLDAMLTHFGEQYATASEGQTLQGRSVHEIVTMASIIQREAANDEEMPQVAAAFWNRIDPEIDFPGRLLGADPTVQYVLGNDQDWWPKLDTMTVEEINAVNSPYNTRVNPGLPPGPISNPGLAALKAAVNPADSNILYFVAKCEGGGHNFTETYEEFLTFQDQYLNCPEPTR